MQDTWDIQSIHAAADNGRHRTTPCLAQCREPVKNWGITDTLLRNWIRSKAQWCVT